jgi:AraC family transcriptional regulator of adaptative response/methylated-DNA-[protein]-cysteine methyltransferase
MNDYDRVAKVIRYLDVHHDEQPDLHTLAGHIGLSIHHFHRLFSDWAGITPKDFLQCLTLTHAKQLLRSGESVLQAAMETGLSGPGRLHDLFVSLEAVSPGELKSGGAGINIHYGVADSPFGNCLIAQSERGICHISFIDEKLPSIEPQLRTMWPRAKLKRDDISAAKSAGELFYPNVQRTSRTPLKAFVRGTAFQIRIWRALLHIPPGTCISYKALAALSGHPSSARAVGTAAGNNPLAYLIPCHRVIRETGLLGGYRWGLDRKRALLAWETAPRSA